MAATASEESEKAKTGASLPLQLALSILTAVTPITGA